MRLQLTKRYRPLTAYIRLILWGVGLRSPLSREETIDGVPIHLIARGTRPAETPPSPWALAVIDNEVLWASRVEDLREVLASRKHSVHAGLPDQGSLPAAERRLRALLPAATPDLWGCLNLERPEVQALFDTPIRSVSASDLLGQIVFTGDVVSEDRIDLAIALELLGPARNPGAGAEDPTAPICSLFARHELRFVSAGPPRWVDERTAVVEGRLEGVAEWVDRMIKRFAG